MIHVRNLGRHREGHWIAEVSRDNQTWLHVHRKYGSWLSGDSTTLRDIAADVALELQTQVKKLERKGA